jgi:hypothetical protein
MYYENEDFLGFRCICGQWVAVMHKECKALLTEEDLEKFRKKVQRGA